VSALRLQSKSSQTDRPESGDIDHLSEARFAHDLNNLLTVIIGAVEALSDDLPAGSVNQELALVSLRAAECGAGLVRRLLDASVDVEDAPQIIDCADVVASLRPLTANLLAEGVVLSASAPPYPLACVADQAELQSALLNLCINARDAMPRGGAIVLRADCRWLEGPTADGLGLTVGSYAVFTVSDTGSGMSPQTVRRAMEPYFTTKGEAGTGLGLSNVEAFVRKLGGALSITSRLDFGTTVQLYIPRAQAPAPSQRLAGRGAQLIDLQSERNPS
jgi:signal transduction histidine kinase